MTTIKKPEPLDQVPGPLTCHFLVETGFESATRPTVVDLKTAAENQNTDDTDSR
jgi:hypothetical protein